jgi:hypothetical protein
MILLKACLVLGILFVQVKTGKTDLGSDTAITSYPVESTTDPMELTTAYPVESTTEYPVESTTEYPMESTTEYPMESTTTDGTTKLETTTKSVAELISQLNNLVNT